MAEVKTEITINAPAKEVYLFSKEVDKFPEFMPDMKSIEILEKKPFDGGTEYLSRWVGSIQKFNLTVKWEEIDRWDDRSLVCEFYMPEGRGDYEVYKGVWKFADNGDGTTLVTLSLEVEYNVPMVGGLIKKLIAKLVKENADGMLEAIKKQMEKV
ncbi:MAG: SRPBCC family protein [Abditibacteriota bacterium]|nr:SRPBCC family protein [Abditibacteriota bacterium]